MKVFLCYPCGKMYQRGEDRCQSNIESSTATSMRACNDLGYMAAKLLPEHDVFLRDYQTEKALYFDMLDDLKNFNPNYIVISTTNATIFDDIEIIEKLKKDLKFSFRTILKGAIFFDAKEELLNKLNLKNIDILVGGEIEFIINDIIDEKKIESVPGIFYKKNNIWHKTNFSCWNKNLDELPFPARNLMNNKLYVRPDTNEPMATIQTSRGCPNRCIYCLTPKISGKIVRTRSPQNVFDEITECYNVHGIKNFFFKADTFTINKEWVLELCNLIENSDLNGKIAYTANSRVKPISKEVLEAMKRTGCFMIAFGFESGDDETLLKIEKGTTIKDSENAMKLARQVGLSVYGFFMIGFPWENKKNIKKTTNLIMKLDPDFIEIHIALPYCGTKFYDICKKENLTSNNEIGTDYFHVSTIGTKYVSSMDLIKIRKKTILKFHLRPKYIIRKLLLAFNNPIIIKNYFKYGIRLIRNTIKN